MKTQSVLSVTVAVVLLLVLESSVGDESAGAGHVEEAPNSIVVSHLQNVTSVVHAIIAKSNLTSNITNHANTAENLISEYDELEHWEAPAEITKNYPLFLSGYDDDDRPIWIAELGKFDMRKLVDGGEGMMSAFNKYVKKLIAIMLKSIKAHATPENPVDRGIFVVDFDDMKLVQLAHLPTISYCLSLMKEYRHLIEDHMAKVYILNANFVAESGLNLAKPILGHMFNRFEIYGTNKAKWIPHLLHALPKDQLPEWYGGTKGHKPLLIYG